jgi:transcriptional regulator with XRE-family HTH domain
MARTKSVAVWIRRNRQANGWTQSELADKLGYAGPAVVSQWENHKAKPAEENMEVLENLFGPFHVIELKEDPEADDVVESNDFSLWLRSARHELGWTLKQLSERSGVNISTISQIENERILSPQEKTWNKLVKAIEEGSGSEMDAEQPPTQEIEPKRSTAGLGELRGFNPYADEERPTTAGIYVLYDISDRPVYVGEGGNIRKRIKDHEEKFWFKRPIVETAAYIEVDDDKLRVRVEKMLINFLRSNAVLNKQHVDR